MMLDMMASMDSSGMAKKGFYEGINDKMDVRLDSLNATNPDIKLDMSFDTTDNKLSIMYSFSSIEEANNVSRQFSDGKEQPESANYKWIKPMKVLQMPEVDTGGGQSGQMQGLDQTVYKMTRTFPFGVAKVSDNRMKISPDGKTVTLTISFKELIDNPMKNPTVYFK